MVKQWRFILRSETRGEVELNNEPMNWRERETRLVRDMKTYGVTREVTSPIIFIKDGAAYVRDVYNKDGYNAKVYLDIFEYDTVSRQYESYFSGRLIMKSCDITDTQVQVLATPSEVSSLIRDKGDKEVELDTFLTFTGQFVFNVPKVIVGIHSFVINRSQVAKWNQERSYSLSAGELLQIGFDRFDVDEIPGWIKERATIDSTQIFPLIKVEESGDYTFDVDFYVKVSTTEADELQFYYRVNQNTPVAVTTTFANAGGQYYCRVQLASTLALTEGDAFSFYAESSRTHTATIQYQTGRPAGLTADKFNVTAKTVKENVFPFGLPAFEAFDQVLKVITGKQTVLLSNALGRTDIGYFADGNPGMNLIVSGAGLSAKPDNLKVSFNKLYESFHALYNLGMDVVLNPDGNFNVVIEPMEFFFSKRKGITISGISNLRKRVANELIFDEIEVGFTKYESNLSGSINDAHCKATYTVPGEFVNQKLQIVSDLVGSSYFIEQKRRDFGKLNTRVTGDEDVFIVNLTKELGVLKARKNEGFDTVTGQEESDTIFNLDIHPARVIRRWGSYINALFYKKQGLIRFTGSNAPSTLSSLKTGEVIPSVENQSINSEELPPALFFPEIYEFECKLTSVQDRLLLLKKYDVIEVIDGSDRYYGYLLERTRKENNEASFTLLRAAYNG